MLRGGSGDVLAKGGVDKSVTAVVGASGELDVGRAARVVPAAGLEAGAGVRQRAALGGGLSRSGGDAEGGGDAEDDDAYAASGLTRGVEACGMHLFFSLSWLCRDIDHLSGWIEDDQGIAASW